MQKRVLIVDFCHMAHTYFHSRYRLSTKVVVNGEVMEKDTTVQNSCVKNIHKWSNGGVYPTAVCFDRPVPCRKAFWQRAFPEMEIGSGKEYKGNREKMPDAMYEAVVDCENILRRAGVSCFSEKNYEADDLIFACIKRAKEKYPGMPIDIVTNDADLLPLVDDTVSIFLRSRKGTYAVDKALEKAHYVQVTPENYQSVVEDLSAYKGFEIPYNTLLLHKLLRGDSSDQFHRKDISRVFPKSKYNDMIYCMIADNINFSEIFRYGSPTYTITNKVTGEEFQGTMEDALHSPDRKNLKMRMGNSEQLDAILEVLREYSPLTEEQLDIVKVVYLGMNLNQPYANPDPLLRRFEYKVGNSEGNDINPFDEIELQKAVSPLGINLKIK